MGKLILPELLDQVKIKQTPLLPLSPPKKTPNQPTNQKKPKQQTHQRIPHFFQEAFFSWHCQVEKGSKELSLCDSSNLGPCWQGMQLQSKVVLQCEQGSSHLLPCRTTQAGLSRDFWVSLDVACTGHYSSPSFTVRCTVPPNPVLNLTIFLSCCAVWPHCLHIHFYIISLHMHAFMPPITIYFIVNSILRYQLKTLYSLFV